MKTDRIMGICTLLFILSLCFLGMIGYNIGHSEGYNIGHSEGYNIGHSEGYNIGHSEGYNECLERISNDAHITYLELYAQCTTQYCKDIVMWTRKHVDRRLTYIT